MWKTKRNAGKRGKGDLTRSSGEQCANSREMNTRNTLLLLFSLFLSLSLPRDSHSRMFTGKQRCIGELPVYMMHIYFRLYSLHIYIHNKGSVCISSHLLGRPSSPLDQILQFALWKSNTLVEDHARIRIHVCVCLCACFLPSSGAC